MHDKQLYPFTLLEAAIGSAAMLPPINHVYVVFCLLSSVYLHSAHINFVDSLLVMFGLDLPQKIMITADYRLKSY